MDRYINADKLLREFPIRINHYDKENGDRKFVLGIESVMDYIQTIIDDKPEGWVYTKEENERS